MMNNLVELFMVEKEFSHPPAINRADPIDSMALGATEQQHRISWDQFLRGRMSRLWAETQEEYLKSLPERPTKLTGHKWAVHVVEAATTLLMEIWKERNTQS
jgi:hypothetical protein